MNKPLLLIDGDEYLYKATAANEMELAWDDENIVLAVNVEAAWDTFSGSISKLLDDLEGSKAYLAFNGRGNFRKDVYPLYKSNRSGKRKPLGYQLLLERAFNEYRCFRQDGLEGDDVLGIWSTSKRFGHTIVVSSDKDMKTLPVTIYREDTIMTITEGEANYFWMKQTLTGDTSDGYPGCPGIGEVKANKLLGEFWRTDGADTVFIFEAAWEAVVRTFEAAGLTYEDALTQARLARILRHTDWKDGEVKLWTP